ncbi:hypothetical protein DK853_27920, partial [Klebsiella oxytoca]
GSAGVRQLVDGGVEFVVLPHGGLLLPPNGGLILALRAGGISAMKMAGPLHPPFSLFLPEEKEKTGRARSKREKEVTGDTTGARLNERRSRNDFPHAIRLGGGLSRDEWTSSSFRCR